MGQPHHILVFRVSCLNGVVVSTPQVMGGSFGTCWVMREWMEHLGILALPLQPRPDTIAPILGHRKECALYLRDGDSGTE